MYNFVFQLVLTVGLLAVVVYLYTVVAFNFFRKFYNKSEDGDMPDMKCDDMLTVSLSLLSVFFFFFLKLLCFCPVLFVIPVHIFVSLACKRKTVRESKGTNTVNILKN